MTHFKLTALTALALTCTMSLSAHAQAGSPATKKTIEEIRDYDQLNDPAYVFKSVLLDGTPVSVGFSNIGHKYFTDPVTHQEGGFWLTELTVNGRPIDPQTFDAINNFLHENIKWIGDPEYDVIICSKYAPPHVKDDFFGPCEEVRIKFHNTAFEGEFEAPETGEPRGSGDCAIWIEVRTRDASAWCYGHDGPPPTYTITYE